MEEKEKIEILYTSNQLKIHTIDFCKWYVQNKFDISFITYEIAYIIYLNTKNGKL
jgi:hypothetical protein